MKRTEEDKVWGDLLKQESHQPDENEWFTRRVLNRLPEREHRRLRWVWAVLSVLAFMACTLCWVWLLHDQDRAVITMRDLINFISMGIISLVVLWQTATVAMKME